MKLEMEAFIMDNLNKTNQNLVLESVDDPEKQYLVGTYLIEGLNDFPKNICYGKNYLHNSIENKSLNGTIYYIRMLLKGNIISRNIEKAKEYLQRIENNADSRICLIKGIISKKEKNIKMAKEFYEEGNSMGNTESMYKYAKLIFLNEIRSTSSNNSIKYFQQAADQGYQKSSEFLKFYSKMNSIESFKKLQPIAQYLFISALIKSKLENNKDLTFNEIKIDSKKTEILFFNDSLKSSIFLDILKRFKNIFIEVQYPSKAFKLIIEHISKIQFKIINHINIGISILNAESKGFKIFKNRNISYFTFDKSIEIIKRLHLQECKSFKHLLIPPSVTEIVMSFK